MVAEEPCLLAEVPAQVVWQLIERSNVVARNLLLILSSRLRSDNQMLLDRMIQQQDYERFSKLDRETGLLNHGWLEEMLPALLEKTGRDGSDLAVIAFSIDPLRAGFIPLGDYRACLLEYIGELVRHNLRPGDVAVRRDEHSFLVLLPETNHGIAFQLGERLLYAVRAWHDQCEGAEAGLPLTVSIGGVGSDAARGCGELLELAQQALDYSYGQGGDRVTEPEGLGRRRYH